MDVGAQEQDGVARHLAETTRVYDSLPYNSRPIFRTFPTRLAAMAQLYGLDPVPPAKARILELGCAAGGNLIPLAARYPEARFVGIDLGQKMIEDGQSRIQALGLTNIDLRFESITEFPDDGEPFDYIICHGVFSWVPAPVREKILEICGRQLSPNGIAYISYNVLPGWRVFQPIRDAMRIVSDKLGEVERAKEGRQLLAFLEHAALKGTWGDIIRRVPKLVGDDDAYLFHEYMEPVNEPSMFVDFVSDARRHGLTYLSESELSAMFPQAHGEEFAAKVERVTHDIVQQQQMLDILTGAAFRTSLLVRQDLADDIDRSNAGVRLGSVFLTRSGICDYERVADDHAKLISKNGAEDVFTNPVAITLLDRLFDPVPRSRSLEEWVEGLEVDGDGFSAMLSDLLANGVVVPMSERIVAAPVGEKPLADRLVRIDAALRRSETANLLHIPVSLNQDLQILLPHLDGQSTHEELAEIIADAARKGAIDLSLPDGTKVLEEDMLDVARHFVALRLDNVARLGLLAG